MKYLAVVILCITYLFGGDTSSLLRADKKGVDLGVFGLRVAAVDGQASMKVARPGPERILVTPLEAVEVSQGKVLLARLSPGKTYYFEGEPSVRVKWGPTDEVPGDTASVLRTDKKGADLGLFDLWVAAVDGQSSMKVVRTGPGRILVTPLEAVEVSQGKVVLARLSPGKTYYFEDEQQPKAAMARKVKWGIVAGVAAGVAAGVGLKLALDEPEPVSRR